MKGENFMTLVYNMAGEKIKRRMLRKNMSITERILWSKLRARKLLGYKFKRQYSVGKFVLDFYCPQLKLAIEVDGDSHFINGADIYDKERQRIIEAYNITFLRFTNNDIYENLNGVIERIEMHIKSMKMSTNPPVPPVSIWEWTDKYAGMGVSTLSGITKEARRPPHIPPLPRETDPPHSPLTKGGSKRGVIITGGAGFIGSNTAARLISEGYRVVIFDNLSRKGSERNLEWLKGVGRFEFIKGDVRDFSLLKRIFARNKFYAVIHLAAQVAVTTSVKNPREDFEINALGTLNLLEAVRQSEENPVFIYASTNKVYGSLEKLKVKEKHTRFVLPEFPDGIPEDFPLDFHSPYGCSKGTADQYVRDYGRIYGMKTVVLRQSCIYGPHQFGIEDQGWVAWFIKRALSGKPITIYGNGKQVRDLLFIDDLVELYVKIIENSPDGRIYNVGGGKKNTCSLIELIRMIEVLSGKRIRLKFSDFRPGDQKVFVCDISRLERDLSWSPHTSVEEGVGRLFNWLKENNNR